MISGQAAAPDVPLAAPMAPPQVSPDAGAAAPEPAGEEGGAFTPPPVSPFRAELGATAPPHVPPPDEAAREAARRIVRERVQFTDGGLLQRDTTGCFMPETVPVTGEVVVEPLNGKLLQLEELSEEALREHGGPVNVNIFHYLRRPECNFEFRQYAEEVREPLRPSDRMPPGNAGEAKYHAYRNGEGQVVTEIIAIVAPNFNAGPSDAPYAGCGGLPVEYFKAKDLASGEKGVTEEQEMHVIHALKTMYTAIFREMFNNNKKKIRLAPVASGNNAGNFSKRMGRLTVTALVQVFEDMSDEVRAHLLDSEALVTFCIFPDFNKPGRRLMYLQEQRTQTAINVVQTTWDHYEFVLDDSGSMSAQRDAVISGYNKFVENVVAEMVPEQKVTFALQKFGENSTVENNESFTASSDILRLEPLDFAKYNPMSGTPLHVAIIKTLEEFLPAKLDALGDRKPDSVNVIVLTDGQDSSPAEYAGQPAKDRMIALLADKRNLGQRQLPRWFFTYMGEGEYVNSGPGMGFLEDELFRYLQSSVFRGFDNAARAMRGRRGGGMQRGEREELQRQADELGSDDAYRGAPEPSPAVQRGGASRFDSAPPMRGATRGGKGGGRWGGAAGVDIEIVWE